MTNLFFSINLIKSFISLTFVLCPLMLNAEVLIAHKFNSGFSPEPMSQVLFVDDSGEVIVTTSTFRNGKTITETLAQLSPSAVTNLKENINLISDNAQLIDREEGLPYCADAPATSVTVSRKNVEIVISQFASCHHYFLNDGYAERLNSFIEGLKVLFK